MEGAFLLRNIEYIVDFNMIELAETVLLSKIIKVNWMLENYARCV